MLKNFFILLFLIGITVQAQTRIKGKIFDQTSRKKLYDVSIIVKGTTIGTVSDKNGLFEIVIPRGISKLDSIVFSRIDYQTVYLRIDNFKSKSQTILMNKKVIDLNPINLRSKVTRRSHLRFEELTSMKSAAFAFASIVKGGKLYVFGGDTSMNQDTFREAVDRASSSRLSPTMEDIQRFWNPSFNRKRYLDKIQIYDFKKDQWSVHELKTTKRAYHSVGHYKNEFYLFGGKKLQGYKKKEYLLNEVEIIDLNTSKISTDNVNPGKAVNFASVTHQDYFFSLGGSLRIQKNGRKVFRNDIHAYNFKSGYWYHIGKMPEAMESSAVNLGKHIFLIGGFTGKISDQISMFNSETGLWSSVGKLFYPIEFPALTSHKNKIYIFDSGKIIVFDQSNFTLSQYDVKIYLERSSIHVYNDKLFIVGGYQKNQHSKSISNSLFSIDLKEFNKTKHSLWKEL